MLRCKRNKFTLPPSVTYLNCAYMSPLLKAVEKAGINGLRAKRNPALISPEDFFTESDNLREAFARLIHAPKPEQVVIIPSVSYGMANVTRNLRLARGENVVLAARQFPSNFYPWQRLCHETGAELRVVAPPETLINRGRLWNERLLESIDASTRVVAIAPVHWADGTRFDLAALRQRTHEVNALLIIDGTQAVGAMPFDVMHFRPDALICAGYKWLFGPYGIGLAYYSEYFDNGTPVEENWINRVESHDFTNLVNYRNAYRPGALRYEVGEHSNFILVPMMLRAIQQLNNWKPEQIEAYCRHITQVSLNVLKQQGFWIEDDAWRGAHLFGIGVPPGTDMEKVKAHLLRHKIYVSYRGDFIRVSVNVYNREEDMNRFVRELQKAVKQ